MPKGMKVIGVIYKLGASKHGNRLDTYGVTMVRECNRTALKNRENLACHPLDRNSFQYQLGKGLDKRKGGIGWINWEVETLGFKVL